MKAFYTDIFVLPLPDGHRFPMAKYAMLREQVATLDAVEMHIPPAATDVELIRVHTLEYVSRVQTGHLSAQEIRRIGFPWSLEMVERSRRSSGATIAACRAAIVDGTAVNLAGGTHHAFADRGGGYCVFNDAAIAARAMQAEGFAKRVLIVDCDVHQATVQQPSSAMIPACIPSLFMAKTTTHSTKNKVILTLPCPMARVMMCISLRWQMA